MFTRKLPIHRNIRVLKNAQHTATVASCCARFTGAPLLRVYIEASRRRQPGHGGDRGRESEEAREIGGRGAIKKTLSNGFCVCFNYWPGESPVVAVPTAGVTPC